MLKLPNRWNSITVDAVVTYLIGQVGLSPLKTDFARTIIQVSLELMLKALAYKPMHR